MNQNQSAHPRLNSLRNSFLQRLKALPFKAQVVLGVFLLAALGLALHTAVAGKDSSLHLRLQHGFRSAQLTVLIDGNRAYAGKLTGYSKKKYALFGESVEGSLSQVFPVTPGTHQILVRIEPGDGTIQEDKISGVFSSNVERDLAVSARRSGLTLNWHGETEPEGAAASGPSSAPSDSGPSWFSRYAASLFLTAAGSIISAITGLAVKELPGYLRTRQDPGKPSTEVGTQS